MKLDYTAPHYALADTELSNNLACLNISQVDEDAPPSIARFFLEDGATAEELIAWDNMQANAEVIAARTRSKNRGLRQARRRQ